ncbi:hypothetical protein HK405_008100, partial [Cladochytrium tenue]
MAGYRRSGSKWKAVIEYCGDEDSQGPSSSSASGSPPGQRRSPVSSTSGGPPGSPRPRVPPGLSGRYEVPGNVSFGHCDILGGRDADRVWERIADWLDATSSREREWRFRRRFSAR